MMAGDAASALASILAADDETNEQQDRNHDNSISNGSKEERGAMTTSVTVTTTTNEDDENAGYYATYRKRSRSSSSDSSSSSSSSYSSSTGGDKEGDNDDEVVCLYTRQTKRKNDKDTTLVEGCSDSDDYKNEKRDGVKFTSQQDERLLDDDWVMPSNSNHESDEDDDGDPATKSSESVSDAGGGASIRRTLKFGKGTTGRRPDLCWELLSDEREQHREVGTCCKWCGVIVRHHGKIDKVRSHLKNCAPFTRSLATMVASDIPEWMVNVAGKGNKKKQKGQSNSMHTFLNRRNISADNSPFVDSSSTPSTLGASTASSCGTRTTRSIIRNKTMKDFIPPAMTVHAKAEFHKSLAMHFYMTGQSFYRMEEKHLIEALKQLRPDVTLPSRKDLSGKLLKNAYMEVKKKVDGWLDRGAYGSLTTDGWSNIKNESVVNYMFVSGADNMSLFLESIETGIESHTAEFLARDISRVIEGAPPNARIAGVVMDNTSANKAAWRILQKDYPSRFFQGCVAHALHLLVKDIFAATKANRGREVSDYPENYPFEPLLTFIAQVKVVSYFHQHHVPKALLSTALKAKNLRMLATAGATRWGSVGEMMKTCLAAEAVLYSVANSREFQNQGARTAAVKADREKIRMIVSASDFAPQMQKVLQILAPIDRALKYYQSDSVMISEVYRTFKERLPYAIRNEMPMTSEQERQYLLRMVDGRFEFICGNAHKIAYVLDPRYLGSLMTREERKAVEDELIFRHLLSDHDDLTREREQQLCKEYLDYRTALIAMMESPGDVTYRMIKENEVSAMQFWQSFGRDWPSLQGLAKKVFSMVATTAASERNFSTFGFIHSKLETDCVKMSWKSWFTSRQTMPSSQIKCRC
jgi:Protein of unknown function (DUF 659)/hAT family C-terminal dimerisation region